MKRIYLYGLAGADKQYRVIWHSYIDEGFFSIRNIISHAAWLKIKNPAVESVYAIDMRKGLANDYQNTQRRNSIESHMIFKNILETEGLKII